MYTRCHLCNRSLGANSAVTHMAVGRKLAYDPERGRLWVVCRRCGEWNLTPMEERWEAIEECEALHARADARVAASGVTLARVRGLELIRIGQALPDDIANARYGHRLRRRRRRTRMLRAGTTLAGLGLVGGFVSAGVSVGSLAVTAYLAVFGVVYAVKLHRAVGPRFAVRVTDRESRVVKIPMSLLPHVRLDRVRVGKHRDVLRASVFLAHTGRHGMRGRPAREPDLQYDEDAALPVLRAVLPRLNWNGATEAELHRATTLVASAEKSSAKPEGAGHPSRAPWRKIAREVAKADGALGAIEASVRLALEMAVTEALERRTLAGEAASLQAVSAEASEVAKIADDMFLPDSVTEWIAKREQ